MDLWIKDIALIVLDFDGTLVPRKRSDDDFDDELYEILNAIQNIGVKIIIATGRHDSYIRKRIKRFEFEYIIGYCGNVMYPKRMNQNYCFKKAELKAILEHFKHNKDVELKFYTEDGIACASNDYMQNKLIERSLEKYHINDINGVLAFNIEEYLNSNCEISFSRICIRLKNWDDKEEIKKQFSNLFKDYRLVKTGHQQFEVLHNTRSKASQIKKVMRVYNLSNEQVITIGDDENDYEMLNEFPYSYYVGKQNQELIQVAGFVEQDCKSVLKEILKNYGENHV